MLGSKIRQIRFGLRRPSVTLDYPLGPLEPAPNYRGHVVVDTERCVGCGGCAEVCPARCVLITDLDAGTRVIRRYLERCILCGRCQDACAYEAVKLAADWETATPDRRDLVVEQRLFMGVCDRCGRCYVPAHPLDRMREVGMRCDEPELLAAARAADVTGPGRTPDGGEGR